MRRSKIKSLARENEKKRGEEGKMDLKAVAEVVDKLLADLLPGTETLNRAAKLGITEQKPIRLDYFLDSMDGRALIANVVYEDGTSEKRLVKSSGEYTDPIQKILKVLNDCVVITDASIYIVSAKIPVKTIDASALASSE
jgi:hypothetical protein